MKEINMCMGEGCENVAACELNGEEDIFLRKIGQLTFNPRTTNF
jgi:hypothetical protein